MLLSSLKLCLVTHIQNQPLVDYKKLLLQAIAGGVTSIQLRQKTENPTLALPIAFALKQFLKPFNIPLIINDHIEIANIVDADGIHIGQSDINPKVARKIIGPDKIIGLSIETLEELERANQLDCIDYVAASAVFPSKTKFNCRTIWGIDGLEKIVNRSKHPVIAIGGIAINNIAEVFAKGAAGAAVISAIHGNIDPQQAAAELTKIINLSIRKRKTHVC
jgi:thiamine-phosphate pyrophosphorylase